LLVDYAWHYLKACRGFLGALVLLAFFFLSIRDFYVEFLCYRDKMRLSKRRLSVVVAKCHEA
jgi:hypothetical protein